MSTPYSTAKQLFGVAPSWLGGTADAERIQSYAVYDDMYRNNPDTFKVVWRGTPDNPIYIPSARVIIDTIARYVCKDWDFVVDPRAGTPADQQLVNAYFTNLFKRETLWTKFNTQKTYGLVRGDAIWHVIGNDLKEPGKRLSVMEVDPGSYFPIFMDDDQDRLIGCHLVDQIEYDKKVVVRRQTYRKDPETGTITTELALFELAAWDDRDAAPYTTGPNPTAMPKLKLLKQLVPPTALNPLIKAIPVYHIKNSRMPQNPFGSSELVGLERISAAVNQAISDEELSLALEGIGVYWTTSGPPTDKDGNEVNWVMGPGRVVEVDPDTTFGRVDGMKGLPALEHIKFILDEQRRTAGVSDIAMGKVGDVQVAESGIALALELAPIISKGEEKEKEMLGVYDQLLYDLLTMWMPAYEGIQPNGTIVASIVGDAMPVNRDARIKELLSLVGTVITAEYARQKLVEWGYYEFPQEMGEAVVAEQQALAEARAYDPFASRVWNELTEGAGASGA